MNQFWVIMCLTGFAVWGDALSPLTVIGNRLAFEATNKSANLHGANAVGALFNCIANTSIFDGPTDEATIRAMRGWNIDIVRFGLNEDCLLGINGVGPAFSGPVYQQAVVRYVQRLIRAGLYVIIELHWTAPGNQTAKSQMPMPDADHAIIFWSTIATALSGYRQVMFDVFNEPFPDNNTRNSTMAWTCWRDGGAACTDLQYSAAGMQTLVDAVRDTGAANVILLGGINYANSLTMWTQYAPVDPLSRIVASWHSYSQNYCNNSLCWESEVLPVLEEYPVIAGEIGEPDCTSQYISPLTAWLEVHNITYLAWGWHPWACSNPSLVTSYNGSCTDSYGCWYKDHLLSLPPY